MGSDEVRGDVLLCEGRCVEKGSGVKDCLKALLDREKTCEVFVWRVWFGFGDDLSGGVSLHGVG